MRAIAMLWALLVCLACSKDDTSPSKPKVYDITGSLSHDSQIRTYRVHLPTDYHSTEESFPLVLALHGGGGSGEQFEIQSELSDKADAAGFVVAYPDGLLNPNVNVRTWNAGKCCGQNASTLDTDDVGFIASLIEQLVSDYRIDAKRVYATGHSNGGMMTYRLADELSSKIAAIAPNAGNFQIEGIYNPNRNVPVLQIISVLDENVIYEGGMSNGPAKQYNPPIDSCLNEVAEFAQCSISKQTVLSEDLYAVYKWSNCASEKFEVLLYLTKDGGHSWPGGNKGSIFADAPSNAFSNNEIIWEFFQRHQLP